MNILKLYEGLLGEAEITSCVRSFGQELFGQELGGHEKDTNIEQKYAKMIADFSSDHYGPRLKPDFIKAVHKLKSCTAQYPNVLIPDNTKIYRGLTIPLSYFIKHKQPIYTNKPIEFRYSYLATSSIQSWSTNFDIASIFGNNMDVNLNGDDYLEVLTKNPKLGNEFLNKVINEKQDMRIPFVLTYTTNPNDFLFKAVYFSILSNNSHEEEVLRINNAPANVIARFNDHEDVFLTYGGVKLLQSISQLLTQ